MRKCTFKQRRRWLKWVNHFVVKKSNNKFKNGLKTNVVVSVIGTPYSETVEFLMGDGTIVDCRKCELLLLLNP